jgi:hypothetical protein
MDMTTFMIAKPSGDIKLLKLCDAIRRNKRDILVAVFQFLNEDPPNASAAQEAFEEMNHEDQIAIFSVSKTAGGIWETWEREALKTGQLGPAWDIWAARHNRVGFVTEKNSD